MCSGMTVTTRDGKFVITMSDKKINKLLKLLMSFVSLIWTSFNVLCCLQVKDHIERQIFLEVKSSDICKIKLSKILSCMAIA